MKRARPGAWSHKILRSLSSFPLKKYVYLFSLCLLYLSSHYPLRCPISTLQSPSLFHSLYLFFIISLGLLCFAIILLDALRWRSCLTFFFIIIISYYLYLYLIRPICLHIILLDVLSQKLCHPLLEEGMEELGEIVIIIIILASLARGSAKQREREAVPFDLCGGGSCSLYLYVYSSCFRSGYQTA